jgi:hypothetical protein
VSRAMSKPLWKASFIVPHTHCCPRTQLDAQPANRMSHIGRHCE